MREVGRTKLNLTDTEALDERKAASSLPAEAFLQQSSINLAASQNQVIDKATKTVQNELIQREQLNFENTLENELLDKDLDYEESLASLKQKYATNPSAYEEAAQKSFSEIYSHEKYKNPLYEQAYNKQINQRKNARFKAIKQETLQLENNNSIANYKSIVDKYTLLGTDAPDIESKISIGEEIYYLSKKQAGLLGAVEADRQAHKQLDQYLDSIIFDSKISDIDETKSIIQHFRDKGMLSTQDFIQDSKQIENMIKTKNTNVANQRVTQAFAQVLQDKRNGLSQEEIASRMVENSYQSMLTNPKNFLDTYSKVFKMFDIVSKNTPPNIKQTTEISKGFFGFGKEEVTFNDAAAVISKFDKNKLNYEVRGNLKAIADPVGASEEDLKNFTKFLADYSNLYRASQKDGLSRKQKESISAKLSEQNNKLAKAGILGTNDLEINGKFIDIDSESDPVVRTAFNSALNSVLNSLPNKQFNELEKREILNNMSQLTYLNIAKNVGVLSQNLSSYPDEYILSVHTSNGNIDINVGQLKQLQEVYK